MRCIYLNVYFNVLRIVEHKRLHLVCKSFQKDLQKCERDSLGSLDLWTTERHLQEQNRYVSQEAEQSAFDRCYAGN